MAPHARLAYLLTTHAVRAAPCPPVAHPTERQRVQHSDHSMGNEEFVRLCGSEGTQVRRPRGRRCARLMLRCGRCCAARATVCQP